MRSFSSSLVNWARGRGSLFLVLLAMSSTFWSWRSTAAEPEPQERPYVLESYYKARWGQADEFIRLFKKFQREEQRRFEILVAHWDLPLVDVDLEP